MFPKCKQPITIRTAKLRVLSQTNICGTCNGAARLLMLLLTVRTLPAKWIDYHIRIDFGPLIIIMCVCEYFRL